EQFERVPHPAIKSVLEYRNAKPGFERPFQFRFAHPSCARDVANAQGRFHIRGDHPASLLELPNLAFGRPCLRCFAALSLRRREDLAKYLQGLGLRVQQPDPTLIWAFKETSSNVNEHGRHLDLSVPDVVMAAVVDRFKQ